VLLHLPGRVNFVKIENKSVSYKNHKKETHARPTAAKRRGAVMGVRRGGGKTGICPPWKLDLRAINLLKTRNQKLIPISWVKPCNDSLFAGAALALRTSQVHCPGSGSCSVAVMSLRFTFARSFVFSGRLWNLEADCSGIGPYCVTITWPQSFKGWLQVTVVGVLPHVTADRRHLGR